MSSQPKIPGPPQGNDPNAAAKKGQDAERKRQAAEEQRQMMLARFIEPDARERISRIRLVKPEKANAVEEHCIRLGMSGQLSGDRINEPQIVQILQQLSEQEEKDKPKVTIQRRRSAFDDSDSEEDLDDL